MPPKLIPLLPQNNVNCESPLRGVLRIHFFEILYYWKPCNWFLRHILRESWAQSISENMGLINSVRGSSFDQCAFSFAQISNLCFLEKLLGRSATALLNLHSLHFYENKSAEKLRKFMLGWTQGRKMHKIHDKS